MSNAQNIAGIWADPLWVSAKPGDLYLVVVPYKTIPEPDWTRVNISARNAPAGRLVFIAHEMVMADLPVMVAGAVNSARLGYLEQDAVPEVSTKLISIGVTYDELQEYVSQIQNVIWQKYRGIGG